MTKKVFLDPGHGDHDPGTSGNGLVEKERALKIALKTRSMLLNGYKDIAVNMSRTDDSFLTLSQRADKANDWDADIFVSIHHNGGNADGFETFRYSGLSSSSLQSKLHSHILKRMREKASWIDDRGKKFANFAVLRETRMHAVLTENLFLQHEASANLLKQDSFLNAVARGHAEGIADYLNLVKKTTAPPEDDMATAKEIVDELLSRNIGHHFHNDPDKERPMTVKTALGKSARYSFWTLATLNVLKPLIKAAAEGRPLSAEQVKEIADAAAAAVPEELAADVVDELSERLGEQPQ